MSIKANTHNIFHDAETGMFEAGVTLEEDGVLTSHVVNVPGPISMPYEVLRPALIAAARAKQRAGTFELRVTSVAKRTPQSPVALYKRLFSGPTILDEILGRAA